MISEKLDHARKSPEDAQRRNGRNLHDNQYRTNNDTLDTTVEDGVRDDGERFVDDHVREQQGYKK